MVTHDVSNKTVQKSANLTFVEYCDSLKEKKKEPFETHSPLEKLFITIAEETGKHPGSIRRWYLGTAKPGKLEKQATSNLLKSDVETLFPIESC